jgi:hypothetical protein
MDFDIEDLKKKYGKRPRANIVDMDKLQVMVPVLIREICRLEGEVEKYREYVKTLEKKRPPDIRQGSVGKAEWSVSYDMMKNRLLIKLVGVFDYKSAKMASNAVIGVLANVGKDFDVINDISEIEAITDMRTLFHLRKVRYLLAQAGVRRIVRIDREKESLVSAIFRKHFQQGDIIIARSMDDAEAALDNEGKFLKQ